MTSTFAVVLAGGGPRGAYEAGVLSVLLPALEIGGMKADVFVGTSAGAINAVGFAALSHLDAAASSAAVLDLWREVHAASVVRAPLRAGRSGAKGRRAGALLDTSPLLATLDRIVDWKSLHASIESGGIAAVGVVATSSSTRDSTVFVETAPGLGCPPPDARRAITYVPTTLGPRHVAASSAIPVAFPAVEVTDPAVAAGWYFDGGVRLNTPIKPAIALGARRVLVVATSPAAPDMATPAGAPPPPPGIAAGAAELLYAILDDRMVEDLRALARRNDPDVDGNVIPWTFGGPAAGDGGLLGRLACEVLEGVGPGPARPHSPLAAVARRALGRALAGDPSRGEAFSYAFFDADFIDGAILLGQRDGARLIGLDGMPVWHEQAGGDAPVR
ncbi:MAG: patatin-like phospholipase family protein [Actinomycetota bacterium]|nr:patatin-like phospholipase family protein [Actinomycetota bacterium]